MKLITPITVGGYVTKQEKPENTKNKCQFQTVKNVCVIFLSSYYTFTINK